MNRERVCITFLQIENPALRRGFRSNLISEKLREFSLARLAQHQVEYIIACSNHFSQSAKMVLGITKRICATNTYP